MGMPSLTILSVYRIWGAATFFVSGKSSALPFAFAENIPSYLINLCHLSLDRILSDPRYLTQLSKMQVILANNGPEKIVRLSVRHVASRLDSFLQVKKQTVIWIAHIGYELLVALG